jgi:phospholipid-transporting ATPase
MEVIGLVIYTCVIFVVTGKIAIETSSFTFLHVFSMLLSIKMWLAFSIAYGLMYFITRLMYFTYFDSTFFIMGHISFWLTVLITTIIALFVIKLLKSREIFHTNSNFVNYL